MLVKYGFHKYVGRLILIALVFGAGVVQSALQAASEVQMGSGSASATVPFSPRLLDVGDIPTAYPLLKYELRTDIRFYEGGGVLSKIYLGIFPRFFMGGAMNVRNLIGRGSPEMNNDDAQVLARLLLIRESSAWPAVSLGWDGPAYHGGEERGLYLALSKEIRTVLGYFQLHGGINSSELEEFEAQEHLRGSVGLSFLVSAVTFFAEGDEFFHADGPRFNAGLRVHFEPISLGIEFRDIPPSRESVEAARILRINYTGLF